MTSLIVAAGLTLRDTHCDKSESCGWPDFNGHTVTSLRLADGLTFKRHARLNTVARGNHCTNRNSTSIWSKLKRNLSHGTVAEECWAKTVLPIEIPPIKSLPTEILPAEILPVQTVAAVGNKRRLFQLPWHLNLHPRRHTRRHSCDGQTATTGGT